MLLLAYSPRSGFNLPLSSGDFFELEDRSGAQLETSAGTATCETPGELNSFTGSDQTNSAKTDEIDLTEATGHLSGGECTSDLPFGTAAKLYWGVPGTLDLSSDGKAELTGAPGVVELYWSASETECAWKYKKLKGSTTPGKPVTVTFSKARLRLYRSTTAECPKSADVSIQFDDSWTSIEGTYYEVEGFDKPS